ETSLEQERTESYQLQQKIEDLTWQKSQLEAELSREQQKVNAFEPRLSAMSEHMQSIQQSVQDEQDSVRAFHEQLNQLLKKELSVEQRLDAEHTDMMAIAQQIHDLSQERKLELIHHELLRERDTITVLQQEIDALNREKEEAIAALQNAQKKPLDGKTFAIAGSLSTMNQDEALNLILDGGGRVHSSLSTETNYLLVGRSPGVKLNQAKDLGIQQITEADLLKMLSAS
ncbi:MAG: BRCT domain-containing protein, partial [Leptolyngbyaceae bacterium]|nr:BRCT domain-containing protein [Leptolyngbyaceae bacterium]